MFLFKVRKVKVNSLTVWSFRCFPGQSVVSFVCIIVSHWIFNLLHFGWNKSEFEWNGSSFSDFAL